jgi:biotin operon repressor
LLSRSWIKAQIQALRKQGLAARLRVLKEKLGL